MQRHSPACRSPPHATRTYPYRCAGDVTDANPVLGAGTGRPSPELRHAVPHASIQPEHLIPQRPFAIDLQHRTSIRTRRPTRPTRTRRGRLPTAAGTNPATAIVSLVWPPEDKSCSQGAGVDRRLRAGRRTRPSGSPPGPPRRRRCDDLARGHRTRAARRSRAATSCALRQFGSLLDHQGADRPAGPRRRGCREAGPPSVRDRGPSNRRTSARGRRSPREPSLRSFEHRPGHSGRRSRGLARHRSPCLPRGDAAALDRSPPRHHADPSRSPAEPCRAIRGWRSDLEAAANPPARGALAAGRAPDRSLSPPAVVRSGRTNRTFPTPHLANHDLLLAHSSDASAGSFP